MKKIIMMLLGVAFATCAIAEEVWIEPYSADTNPNDANVSWYSCCFLDLAAVKAATGNQLTTLNYGAFATWLLTSAADNKAATITNASYVMESYEDYWADEQYCFTYNSPQFAAKGYLAVCFFDHGADHAFQVGQIDSRGKYSFDDESAITTGWLALSIAPPQDPIEYFTWDASKKSLVAATNTTYEVVTADTATFEDKKWYVVTNAIERGAITVNGEAHLILCDGAKLKVTGGAKEAGIEVSADKSLTIYGQSEGTGVLTAMGGNNGGAGIGGIRHGTCGTITINGGEINATGGTYGAGIGGSAGGSNGATITINGGTVKATGGLQGAGIGSGNYYDEHVGSRSDTDVIAINGGTITATGGQWGAGIGSGSDGFAATVTINGGTITASTITAEAIGSGDAAKAATTVTFGTALASKHVWAGASATTVELMTTADFATNHSAAYAEVPVEIYTVAYDANGATGVMSNSVFAVAKEVTLKANAFTALGYDFAGWATNSVGDVVYADEATGTDFTTTNATLSLYAKWELDSNGVTATDFTSFTNLLAQAAAQSASLPVTIGFTSGVVIPDGVTVTLPSGGGFAGLAFVAGEGGSGLWLEDGVLYGDPLRGEVTVDALALMKLANGDVVPSAFKALSEGDGGTTVTNDVVVLLGSDGKAYPSLEAVLAAAPLPETVKLFEIKSYTVNFDANGGEGNAMASQELAFGKSACLERNTYTRTDCVFLGWSTDKEATTPTIYNCGAVKNLVQGTDTSVTLYAVWQQPGASDYTIVFVKNEGSGTLVNRVFTNGTKEKLPTLRNLKWERDGYEFLGWATTPAKARAGMVWKANGGAVAAPVAPGETLMVYAIWQLKSGYYEVRYWKNDKPQAPGTDRWRTVAYPYGTGKVMPTIRNGLKWTCDGSTFGGWATSREEAEAGTVWKADASKLVTAAPEGTTLHVYAIWEPISD